ncbi:LysR family transcriptional regulator [Marinobacter salarius]|jgi:DNA-binding transcriptional LysR family regulator|uniref:LysR family transcriptional regulator n=1 Tax=Marinobacter salarius TaxID=1420917 RepID=UPI00241F4140|nr:LysR family transcriptional regulator [Marinobacter salarius]
MLNPQWLRSFVVLADVGSFTRTADQLGLTQAAVSQHVRHLEAQLGTLVIRQPRRMDLTPAGHALLAYCDEMEQADMRLRLRMSEGDKTKGELSLITPGSCGLLLYPLLLDLQEQHPDLVVRHRFAPDTEILDAVLGKRYEIGLVTAKPDDPHLTSSHFAGEPLELIVPAGQSVSSWADLERLGYIDHSDGRAMATRLLSRCFPGEPGIRNIPVRGFVNQVGLILEPVARGMGFTVLPQYARQAFARHSEIKVMTLERDVVDSLWMISRAEWPLSARARYAMEYLRQQLGDR